MSNERNVEAIDVLLGEWSEESDRLLIERGVVGQRDMAEWLAARVLVPNVLTIVGATNLHLALGQDIEDAKRRAVPENTPGPFVGTEHVRAALTRIAKGA